jgi:hypothetical protein
VRELRDDELQEVSGGVGKRGAIIVFDYEGSALRGGTVAGFPSLVNNGTADDPRKKTVIERPSHCGTPAESTGQDDQPGGGVKRRIGTNAGRGLVACFIGCDGGHKMSDSGAHCERVHSAADSDAAVWLLRAIG